MIIFYLNVKLLLIFKSFYDNILNKVDLPEPFSPNKPILSFYLILNDILLSAYLNQYYLLNLLITT